MSTPMYDVPDWCECGKTFGHDLDPDDPCVVHMLVSVESNTATAKCGFTSPKPPHRRLVAFTGWHIDVTCPDCHDLIGGTQ